MKASDARRLTQEALEQVNVADALESIQHYASRGQYSCHLNLSTAQQEKLVSMGYTVEPRNGDFTISWRTPADKSWTDPRARSR